MNRFGAIKRFYQGCAFTLLNVLLLFLALNFLSGIFFLIKDTLFKKSFTKAVQPFFEEDGSPVDTGKRTSYQMQWFDFNWPFAGFYEINLFNHNRLSNFVSIAFAQGSKGNSAPLSEGLISLESLKNGCPLRVEKPAKGQL